MGVKLAVCMYGSIRTFTNPELRLKYKENFMSSITKLNHTVDVFAILVRNPNGQNNRSRTNVTCSLSYTELEEMVYDVFGKCSHFQVIDDNKELYPTASPPSKQLRGIDSVFQIANRHDKYNYFVRVRPDFYWHHPFDHTVLIPDTVVTAVKSDAPASDMFFVLPNSLYHTWWQREVEKNKEQLRCPIEYTIFNNVKVHQHKQINSALMRGNAEKIETWK